MRLSNTGILARPIHSFGDFEVNRAATVASAFEPRDGFVPGVAYDEAEQSCFALAALARNRRRGGGSQLAQYAAGWSGRSFKPGQTRRCADFVSEMLLQSGTAPSGFRREVRAANLRRYGTPVRGGIENLRPGDVVFFGNTYRRGRTTHVGIYLGNGRFVHRPTRDAPVTISNINSPRWRSRYTGANRMAQG